MEFTFAKSKKVLSFHEIICSQLLCIYIKNAETAIIWQNMTHKTTGVREIWAQAGHQKKKKILDELFWDILFSELDSNKSHSAGILSGGRISHRTHKSSTERMDCNHNHDNYNLFLSQPWLDKSGQALSNSAAATFGRCSHVGSCLTHKLCGKSSSDKLFSMSKQKSS